jgi:hypothetical protein
MPDAPSSAFEIPAWMDAAGAAVERWPRAWIRLGNLETRILADEIAGVAVERPIYVTGLARSGTTILLELLAEHPETVSHAYKDFPFVPTPWFWNWFLERSRSASGPAVERAHGDGIRVTPDSPEALEEVLWMAFFAGLHEPGGARVDAATIAPEFETFYREHLRKLLWMRRGRRYLAKGNYNVTRLAYLHRLFPDARFVVPVREPRAHVASLARQHERFRALHERDPRSLRYMRRAGHHEFGLDRRPTETDRTEDADAVRRAWAEGDEARGWALLWNAVYGQVERSLTASPALRSATKIVRHEDLLASPKEMLRAVHDHCGLAIAEPALERAAARVGGRDAPSPFTAAEEELVRRTTADVAAGFGYGAGARAKEAS